MRYAGWFSPFHLLCFAWGFQFFVLAVFSWSSHGALGHCFALVSSSANRGRR